MSVAIQSRRLDHQTGCVSFLHMTYDRDWRLLVRPRTDAEGPEQQGVQGSRSDNVLELRTGCVGTGETGFHLARCLYGSPANRAHARCLRSGELSACPGKTKMAELGRCLEQKHLVFLAGSLADPAFWLARELILSAGPFLLMTLGVSDSDKVSLRPAADETCHLLRAPAAMDRLALSVLLFHSAVATPGFICVGLDDYRQLLAGTVITPLTYEATTADDDEAFARFLEENKALITAVPKIACIVYTNKMEEYEARTGALLKLLGEDTLCIVHDSLQLAVFQPELHFKMQLLCADEPQYSFDTGRPYLRI